MIKRNLNRTIIANHLACWTVFIVYEVLVAYSFSNKFSSFYDYAGHYFLNIGVFYLTAYLVFPFCLQNTNRYRYLLAFVLICIEFVIYMGLKKILYTAFIYYGIYNLTHMPDFWKFVIQGMWRFIYFVGISFGYWTFLSKLVQSRQLASLEQVRLRHVIEKTVMEKELLTAENNHIRAQINPHFLFNILGYVHNQVYQVSAQAGETVMLLADMMRYALSKPQADALVLLSDEVEHIHNYIRINRLRFENRLKLNFNIDICREEVKIIPLLLITIIENIFKHGDLLSEKHPGLIELQANTSEIRFHVWNKKAAKRPSSNTRIGISNIQKRLNLAYPGKHSLRINDEMESYTLDLFIQLYD